MNALVRHWRNWNNRRKFAKLGKHCRFTGRMIEVSGCVELGDYCRIREGSILRTSGNGKIVFADRSGCSYHCVLESTVLIQIGPRTGIAEFTVIRDSNHMVIGTDLHWRSTPLIAKPIVIGSDCLIGSGCYIMPGVTIGNGAVIQAHSLISRDVGEYEVWAGNPARRVCHRTENVPKRLLDECETLIAKYGIKGDRYNTQDPRRVLADRQYPDRVENGLEDEGD